MRNKCSQCLLENSVEVPYRGNPKAKILIVGESPGNDEVQLGKAFVGRAGKLLVATLKEAGIHPKEVYIANSARCLIDKKSLPKKKIKHILKCCRPRLERTIKILRPNVIVCLGEIALTQIMNRAKISEFRGMFSYNKEFACEVFVTYHPAATFYRNQLLPVFQADFRRLSQYVSAGYRMPDVVANVDYKEVTSIRDLLNMPRSKKEPVFVGHDVETQGIDWLSPNTVFISFSYSIEAGKARQVFMYERDDNSPEFTITIPKNKKEQMSVGIRRSDNFGAKLAEYREFCEDPYLLKIMHNGNFDHHHILALFDKAGLKRPKFRGYIADTQVMAQLIDENLYSRSSLELLETSFLPETSNWKKDFTRQYDKDKMILVLRDDLISYACRDSDVTLQVGHVLMDKVKSSKRIRRYFNKLAMPAQSIGLFSIEDYGVKIDREALDRAKKEFEKQATKWENKAKKLISTAVKDRHADKGLKLTRNALIADALFAEDGYNIEVTRRTKGGEPQLDEKARKEIKERSDLPRGVRPFLKAYDEWKEYSNFRNHFLKEIEEHVRIDGRLHTNYSNSTAVTGRVSSRAPMLMNIPKHSEKAPPIRETFHPRAGYVFLESDLSQAELRIIAHVSQDPVMLKIYQNNEDIHTNTARSLDPSYDSLEGKEKSESRFNAKAANFGLIYGMGVKGFKDYVWSDFNKKISYRQAEEWSDTFFETYKMILHYHRRVEKILSKKGYVTSLLGRRRRLPDFFSESEFIRWSALRQAINFVIQSTASDIALLSLITMLEDKLFDFDRCIPVLFIHDSFTFEVRESLVDQYWSEIKRHMENPPLEKRFGLRLRVPLVAEATIGPNSRDLDDYGGGSYGRTSKGKAG